MLSRPLIRSFFLTACLVLSACTSPDIQLYRPLEETAAPETVAVLPFSIDPQFTGDGNPEVIFRKVFFSYFTYLGYRDMPLDEIDRRLKNAGYRSVAAIHKAPPSQLRRVLGVDAVILGRVVDASNITAGVYAETRLKGEIEFWDLKQNLPIWKLDHHEIDLSGIAQSTIVNMVQDQINNSETQLAYYRSAEVFAVKAMQKIPDPGKLDTQPVHPPVITGLSSNISPGQALKEGDTIEVMLQGPAGLRASFDIGSAITHWPMQEIAPGVYQGAYHVKPEDRFDRALIIGRIQDDHGLIGKKILNTLVTKVNV